MFTIDIYSKFEVTEQIKTSYKSYDSDDDWWKEDCYINNYIMDGLNLRNKLIERLNFSDFSDFTINTTVEDCLQLKLNTFDPLNGDGDEFIYFIKRVGEENDLLDK